MLPFITRNIKDPWSISEINQWKSTGSQRDKVLYNPKINARFILEGKNTYSACIKIKSGEYKNFWLVPITRTSFLIIAYVPQLEFLNQLSNIPVAKKIIPRFKLLYYIDNNQNSSEGYKVNEDIRIGSGAIIIKVDESLDDFIVPWNGDINNIGIISAYTQLNNLYSKIVSQVETLYNIAIETNKREIEAIEAKQKQILKKTLIKTGVKIVALCIAPYAVTAIDGVDLLVDGMDVFDMDIPDFRIEDFDDELLGLGDGMDAPDWDSSDGFISESYSEYSNDIAVNPDDSYNVSFQSSDKTITVHQEGNSGRTTSVTAKKVPGTSNQWKIYKGNTYITTLQGILHGEFYLPNFGTAKF